MKEVLESLTAFGPVFNFLFGFTFSKLWEMIEGIQLIAMYPMLQVDTPANIGMG